MCTVLCLRPRGPGTSGVCVPELPPPAAPASCAADHPQVVHPPLSCSTWVLPPSRRWFIWERVDHQTRPGWGGCPSLPSSPPPRVTSLFSLSFRCVFGTDQMPVCLCILFCLAGGLARYPLSWAGSFRSAVRHSKPLLTLRPHSEGS